MILGADQCIRHGQEIKRPEEASRETRRAINIPKYVFADIDETITEHGRIKSETIAAFERLQAAGIRTGLLTGRPAGWANCLIQYFPIDTILSENGALGFNKRDGFIHTWRHPNCVPIISDVGRDFVAAVAKKFPAAVFSQDNDYRLFDFAVEIADTRATDPTFDFIELVDFVQDAGWQVKESSIHFNIWKGVYDKLGGLGLFLKAEGIDPDDVRVNGVFAGDSPNDEPLFGWFEQSYGVAGVEKYLPIIKQHPKHILKGEEGAGFRELAATILGDA